RARRDVDVVLASADVPWTTHCLPAGPLREPWASVERADLVVITRKAATPDTTKELAMRLRRLGAREVALVDLRPGDLRDAVEGDTAPLPFHALEGRKVLAIAGVGNPGAFFAQLRAGGVHVNAAPWPDHHAYTVADVAQLVGRVPAVEYVVCTLKDAVKLRRLWPRSGPTLWYVSQRVELVEGQGAIEGIVRRLLTARSAAHD
ncbi:MAG: tetraacyldisaccharide 4'-kinase, partial [Cytophagaceae bacterium]|nr:tetraacyldisaccharide 4'-kinase [Gemmatimonadaceae bacterium]